MHELSIVMGIIDMATEEAKKAGLESFSEIELDIGTQAGVVMEALDFAWDSAVDNTVLAHAKRKINSIQAIAKCVDCDHEFEAETLFDVCPKCNSYFTQLIQGKELILKSLKS